MDVGEATLETIVENGKALVIQAQEMKHRRMEVVDVHLPLHCVPAVFVGRPVAMPSLGSASREKTGECGSMVTAPIGVLVLPWGPAEFCASDDQGFL